MTTTTEGATMSLTMTADDMHDAYGPDGPDAEDVAAWNLAVDRNAECQGHPDDGQMNGPQGQTFYCDGSCVSECDCRNARDGYCPDCGYDAEQAAEMRMGC